MRRYEFTCTVTGKGGHGAMPDTAVDPVVAAAALIRSAAGCLSGGARVEWRSIQGGTRFNIIPEQVTVTGLLLAPDHGTDACRIQLEEGVRHVMSAFRTQGKLRFAGEVQ